MNVYTKTKTKRWGGVSARLATLFSVVVLALLYSCPADGDGTSSPPLPLSPIAKEIQEKDPAILYNADMHENAQSLFSRGGIDNPYLFTFGVTSIHLIEEISAELTITGDTDNDGEVEQLYQKNMPLHSFAPSHKTLIKNSAILNKMYVMNNDILVNMREGTTVNAVSPAYAEGDYIVGIGFTETDSVDFDMLPEDITISAKIFYEGEDEKPDNEENAELERELLKKGAILKEKTIEVSKADPYKIYTWRDLQHMNDDVTGDYVVQNDIIFPEVGDYGYENFIPIGLRPIGILDTADLDYAFSGTFEGNNHKIEGLFIDTTLPSYKGPPEPFRKLTADQRQPTGVGLFGRVDLRDDDEIPPEGIIRNITIYHAGIAGHYWVGGLIGLLRVTGVENDNPIVSNSHVYALNGAKVSRNKYPLVNFRYYEGYGMYVGGLIGEARQYAITKVIRIKDSSAHTDVSGGDHSGGLIGGGFVAVDNSYATGNVDGHYFVGGLIGKAHGGLTTIHGYATGNVQGKQMVGGLVGGLGFADLVGYATGNVQGMESVGGAIGRTEVRFYNAYKKLPKSEMIVNAYATGNVVGNHKVGGLIGYLGGYIDIFTKAEIDPGRTRTQTIIGYARGSITVSGGSKLVGSLIGGSSDEHTRSVNGYSSSPAGSSAEFNGINIDISKVTSENYRGIFNNLTFGDEAGQWTWVGDGKWPAVNLGDVAPADEQPIE